MTGQISLLLFSFVMAATPGPNNVMVMASGARYGLRRTLPHVLGVALGFPLMLILVGVGVGALVIASPGLRFGLEIGGILLMLWFAWRIATAGSPGGAVPRKGRPIGFFEAMAFQWLNPKAWLIAVAAIAAFVPGHADLWSGVVLIAGIFAATCLPCLLGWAALGRGAGALLLGSGNRFRIFNAVMAALLLLALVPLAWGG